MTHVERISRSLSECPVEHSDGWEIFGPFGPELTESEAKLEHFIEAERLSHRGTLRSMTDIEALYEA